MSKVKINSVEFDEIKNYVVKAQEYEMKAEEVWGDEFENLYYAFITSGFLESLYEDAKSNYYQLQRTCTALVCGMSVVLGVLTGGIGGIIGIVLGAFGIFSVAKSEPTWITTSKEVFEALLTECVTGQNECYIRMHNTRTKLENVLISMEEIRSKINEFNHLFANMGETLDEFNLKATMTDDGVLLSIDTEITVDGKIVTTSVSEALNAFYTYTSTVMSSRIEADYIASKYGVDIDYESLVKNANGFVVQTLNSGLYSHEFVNHILPSYNVNVTDVTSSAAGNLGLSVSDFESVLNKAGTIVGSLGAGLLGASFIGKIDTGKAITPPTGGQTTTGGTNTGGTNTGGTNTGGTNNGGTNNQTQTQTNTVQIEKVSEVEIPQKVESEITKDYDDLARREYEALGEEEISKRRLEIMEEVDKAFESGDLTSIKAKLKEYGYSDPEIEAICADRDKLMLALVEGDQRSFMATKALELAKADGVTKYDTMYDDGQKYSDLTDGTSNVLLANMSADEKVSEAFGVFTKAEETYIQSVTTAAAAVEAAMLSKTAMDELKTKFVKEFGTEDTTKWSESAAKEYNEAVKDYNKKAEDAKTKLDAKDKAKEEYDEAKEDYEEAKVDFADRIKKGLNGENSENDGNGNNTPENENGNNTDNNTGNNTDNNTGNNTGGGNYIGVDEQFPTNPGDNPSAGFEGVPGIGLDMIPDDNALYATENLGINGLYEEVIPGSGVSKDSYTMTGNNASSGNNGTGNIFGNGSTQKSSNGAVKEVVVSIGDSQLDAKDLYDLAATGTPVTSSVDNSSDKVIMGSTSSGYNGGDVYVPSGKSSVVSNGNGVNNVTISDAELIAALSIAEQEAKYK